VRIVACTPDLLDRSKVSAALPGVEHVGAAALLPQVAAGAELVVVDLRAAGVLGAVAELDAGRVVGFGPHVDADLLAAADAAGLEAMPRSRFFRLLEQGSFTPRKQSGNSPSPS
jgi:hypothetical protein